MVRLRLRLHSDDGRTVIPDPLRETWNLRKGSELICAPNMAAALIYPKDFPLEKVLESLKLIMQDLELEMELKQRSGNE